MIYVPETLCKLCDKPISSCELCDECAEGNDYFGTDVEGAGGWMIQDGRGR